jgi:chromosome partitioning protein
MGEAASPASDREANMESREEGHLTIMVASPKGGCGKTTVAALLAQELARAGEVLLIDGDRQGSSLLWFTVARAHGSQLTGISVEKIEGNDRIAERVKTASGFIAVIVEVAGYAEATRALDAVACDLVVIPTQPHILDCYQVVQIVKYLRDMEQGGSPVRHKVVLNRMTAMTRNSVAAKAALDVLRNADVDWCRHALWERSVFAKVMTGAALYELPPDRDGSVARAQNNLRAVVDELLSDFLTAAEDQTEADSD